MSRECKKIHEIINSLERFSFSFKDSEIPKNGIYFLFQNGEHGHSKDRIVRVGSHTGENQLCPRIKQHFLMANKDRSIFRKNIGRALLHKKSDPFLKHWELDLTSRKSKEQYASSVDFSYQEKIEDAVSHYIHKNFTFSVVELKDKKQRLETEKRIISTLSWCDECKASTNWLGYYSPKEKIKNSGLWLVNELYKIPLSESELTVFTSLISG